jgi:hypothetical protein
MISDKKCQWCGKQASSYNSIFIPAEDKNLCVCLHCYNQEISKAAGIDFDQVQLHPVVLTDKDGKDHEFHFSLRLMGDKQVLSAFEVAGDALSGYEFSCIGNTADGIFSVFSQLYGRMLSALNQKHICKNTETGTWQITREDIVRGRISCDDASGEYPRIPKLLIDGKAVSWDEFGRMLMPYQGFRFILQIADPADDTQG